MTQLLSDTVTFLFTDIEGSTREWERDATEMQASLAKHDAIVRGAIEAHGGHVFKTVGDAFYAVFSSASDAVSAALTAQRNLAARLLGAAKAALEKFGERLDRPDQSLYDRSVAAVRQALGDDTFEVAWAEGRAMGIEEAIAEAAPTRRSTPHQRPLPDLFRMDRSTGKVASEQSLHA